MPEGSMAPGRLERHRRFLVLGSYLSRSVPQAGHDSRSERDLAFIGAFVGQATWVSLCLMPVLASNSATPAMLAGVRLKISDALGLALFAGGFILEVVADRWNGR
ncbi:hypothetical protein GGR53DRAFT_526316 [Hypoxylon sp. FL1150]|nr:hypothetical protein GGR53DRAFT_526316 [Hypoxylon sp. FL1150]